MCLFIDLTSIIWKHHPVPIITKKVPCTHRVLELLDLAPMGTKAILEELEDEFTHAKTRVALHLLQGNRSYKKRIEFVSGMYRIFDSRKSIRNQILEITQVETGIANIVSMTNYRAQSVRKMVYEMSGKTGKTKSIKQLKNGKYLAIQKVNSCVV